MFDDDEKSNSLTKIESDSPLSVLLAAPLHLKRLENVTPLELVEEFFSRQIITIDLRHAGFVDLCDAPDQFAVCLGQVGSRLRANFRRGVRRVRFLVDIIGKSPKNRISFLVNTLRGFFDPTVTVFEMELSAKYRQKSVNEFHAVFKMSDRRRWEQVSLAAEVYNGFEFHSGVVNVESAEHRRKVLTKVYGFVHRV